MMICDLYFEAGSSRIHFKTSLSKMKTNVLDLFKCILLVILVFQLSILSQIENSQISEDDQSKSKISVQVLEADLIHFGDLIEVDIVGSSEFDWRGTLTAEGFLEAFTFSENPVYGLCSNADDVAKIVKTAYQKFLRDPEVIVRILDRSNRPVSIISGAIKTPQRLQIKRPIFLNELLTISGGLTDKASGEVQIFRPRDLNCLSSVGLAPIAGVPNVDSRERFIAARQDNGSQFLNIKIADLLSGKVSSNPQILGGDIVTVLESQPIYVIGGVANPTQIAARAQMTLTRAIASAGGILKGADATNISIFRRDGNETNVINANLVKIISEEEEDIMLRAFDIVEVPQTRKENRKISPLIDIVDHNLTDKLRLPLRIID